MPNKPKNPYPQFIRTVLRKLLPLPIYRKYISRHEDGSMRLWKHLATGIPSRNVVLDIGAFHGDYALAARSVNSGVMIYAFEPNPTSASVLQKTVAGLDIHVQEMAVAEQDGIVSFLLASRMSRITTPDPTRGEDVLRVPAVCLDSWVNQKQVVLSLLKIDTEGAEVGILLGARQVLSQYQPAILCEILTDEAGEAVMKALPRGYIFYYIDENNGIEARSTITRKKWRNMNWLFIPGSKRHLVEALIKDR